ncbi:hypothetical protein RISK_004289 [Rhodopirellula islandica]|uniref:Uncharacterized protein n=1 Tax=Rhodopirellula islandica TaxID=595434 RepID=A0A0J1BB84_RHOIS|nr:hypothetical protein RISK_004289 [Rhodopirellula islandica]
MITGAQKRRSSCTGLLEKVKSKRMRSPKQLSVGSAEA